MFEFLIDMVSEEKKKYRSNPKVYKQAASDYSGFRCDFRTDEEKTNFYIAKAIQGLASLFNEKDPAPKNAVIIKSHQMEAGRYLWTAFMLLGSILPNRFDHKSLKNYVVETKNELGYFSRFGSSSLYETRFKQHVNELRIKHFLLKKPEEIEEKKMREELAKQRVKQEKEAAEKAKEEREKEEREKKESAQKKTYDKEAYDKEQRERFNRSVAEDEERARKSIERDNAYSSLVNICRNPSDYDNPLILIMKHLKLVDVNRRGANNTTLLNIALAYQNDQVAEFLIKQGADPYLKNVAGQDAFYFASSGSLIFEAIKKVNREVNRKDAEKRDIAERKRRFKLTDAERKEEDRKEEESEKSFVLSRICANHSNVVPFKTILDSLKVVDVNQRFYNNGTFIIQAVLNQNERVAEFLLQQGADPFLQNDEGHNVFTFVSSGSLIYEALMKKKKEMITQGRFSLTELNQMLLEEVNSEQPPKIRDIKILLNQGAEINYHDEEGYTVLMFAIDNQNDQIAEYLLNQGADPLLQNNNHEIASDLASRNSPIYEILKGYELLYAVFYDDLNQVKALHKAGANINFQGLGGYSPLLIAVEQSAKDMVEFLLSADADLTLTRKDGQGIYELVKDESIHELLKSLDYSNEFKEETEQSSSDEDSSEKTFYTRFFK